MKRHACTIVIALALIPSAAGLGKDIYVDPDRDDGVKTIAEAIQQAQPGDTIHLAARDTPYRESIFINNRSGEPGKPIVIDGHGATITGCDPLRPEDWVQESPGLYRSDKLYADLRGDDTVIQRVFFLFGGQPQRMDRTSKGAKAAWKKLGELADGEWTFVPETQTFYIKVDAAKPLAECGVEIPYRKNGVTVRGTRNEHWIIRNLTVQHVLNDGFNIHHHSRDMRFENIAAFGCGDDGFSAHEGCECEVDGYRAAGNSTGFANGYSSNVKLRNAFISGNVANEILQMHGSIFEIRDTHILATAARPVVIRGNPDKQQVCRGSFDNVLIECRADRARPFEVAKGAVITATRVTTIGLSWQIEGEVDVSQSVIVAGPTRAQVDVRPNGVWKARQNLYDLYSFGINGKSFRSDLAGFQLSTSSDADSRQESVPADSVVKLARRESPFAPLGAALGDLKLPEP